MYNYYIDRHNIKYYYTEVKAMFDIQKYKNRKTYMFNSFDLFKPKSPSILNSQTPDITKIFNKNINLYLNQFSKNKFDKNILSQLLTAEIGRLIQNQLSFQFKSLYKTLEKSISESSKELIHSEYTR